MNFFLSTILVLFIAAVMINGSLLEDMKMKMNFKPYKSSSLGSSKDFFSKIYKSHSASSNSFEHSNNCSATAQTESPDYYCEVVGTLNSENNNECFNSTYFKKIVSSSLNDPLNGVAQCTKTPCGTPEKVKADCSDAFGEKLSQIVDKSS